MDKERTDSSPLPVVQIATVAIIMILLYSLYMSAFAPEP